MTSFWDIDLRTRLAHASSAHSRQERGRLYEELVRQLFQSVDGIGHTESNVFNYKRSQEIDLAFWNDQSVSGFSFLPDVILIECKNWSHPVTSAEIAWFSAKVRERGCDVGILFAAKGVTGDVRDLTFAHQIIQWSLVEKRLLIVVTDRDLENLASSADFVQLIKIKLVQLRASGTSLR